MSDPILSVKNLTVVFKTRFGEVPVIDDVSFSIAPGEILGIVGESGCGKSTVARLVVKLYEPTNGEIFFGDQNFSSIKSRKELKPIRRRIQMIFQDPYAALNPRMTVRDIIAEPLEVMELVQTREEADQKVREIASKCRLNLEHLRRFPHAFSGGQRQRISIARTLVCNPDFVVADESVAALDVSIQADILNLLKSLQSQLGLTFMFISHDLSVVAHICDHVAVMYLGTLVESAPTRKLFSNPRHPYTKALLSSIPSLDPDDSKKAQKLEGEIPSPTNPPSGCKFHTRCIFAEDRCQREVPEWRELSQNHAVACHFAEKLASAS